MGQYLKRKGKVTVILLIEKKDGNLKRRTINSAVIKIAAITFFLLAVVIACMLTYDTITLKDAREEIVKQVVMINDLTDENEALSVENSTLSNKVAVLSETVTNKMATEDAMTQEAIESALPKGFPLSGSATMTVAEGDMPMLIFSSSIGTNVITSGTGTVVSVDVDENYGTRIVIDHKNGYKSVYRNNGSALVKNGEELGKGYILFSVGEDNQELGYQIMQDDVYIDPMLLIEING